MNRIPRLLAAALLTLAAALGSFAEGRRSASPYLPEQSPRKPIRLAAGEWDPLQEGLPIAADLRHEAEEAARTRYLLVQFYGPLTERQRGELAALGAELLGFVPENAFIVRLEPRERGRLQALPFVRWSGPWHPGFRLSPMIGKIPFRDEARLASGRTWLDVHVFAGEDAGTLSAQMAALGAEVLGLSEYRDFRSLRVAVAGPRDAEALASLEGVEFISEAPEITMRNNAATWVAQTNISLNRRLWDLGLHGEGQVVGVCDGALSMASCYIRDDADNTPGPGHRKVLAYHGATGADSHGTHVSGTVAGFNVSGDLNNAGHAHNAKISFTNVDTEVTGWNNTTSNLAAVFAQQHNDGARIHTNSWGEDGRTDYTTFCSAIDTFSRDYEDDLVCFASTNQAVLYTPENSRNVLAVGATSHSPNQQNWCTGGTGPTADGRRKPEIYLPGCSTVSASTGTCGTQTFSGTSMASPAVAGSAALLRQYLTEGWHGMGTKGSAPPHTPTGALMKAMLLNGAVDMTGVAGWPSNQEGWGRLLLDNVLYFEGDPRRLYFEDVRHADGLSTGQMDSYAFTLTGSGEPLRVTLAWTDQPSAKGSKSPVVNKLHLEVIAPGGASYKGNVFSGGVSVTGGAFDDLNNVQQVHLPSPPAGDWEVRVHGAQVNLGTQGYAVVVSGEIPLPEFVELQRGAPALAGDFCPSGGAGDGDGAADPGETIYLNIPVRNAGNVTATSVSGTLSCSTPGVTVVSGALPYPDLDAGSPFTPPSGGAVFEVQLDESLPCGTVMNFTLAMDSAEGKASQGFFLLAGVIGPPESATPSSGFLGTSSGSVTSALTPSFTLGPGEPSSASLSYSFAYAGGGPSSAFFTDACDSLTGWAAAGGGSTTVASTVPDTCPGGGGNYFNFNGGGAGSTDTLSRTVSTAGYAGISVQADWQTSGMDNSSDVWIFQYSTAGTGGPWTTWYTNNAVNSGWNCGQASGTLPAAADNNPNFALRFSVTHNVNDILRLDNIRVSGSPLGSWTANAKVELIDPSASATVLKDYGQADANPYDVLPYYSGAGAYSLRLSENLGGTASLGPALMEAHPPAECVSCADGGPALPAEPAALTVESSGLRVSGVSGATQYVVYGGAIGQWYGSPQGCAAPWADNGDGTVTLDYALPANSWAVVAARNAAGESGAGSFWDGASYHPRKAVGTWLFMGACP